MECKLIRVTRDAHMALTPQAAPEVRALGDPAERTVLVLNPITA